MAGRILRWTVCFSLALACMLSVAGALTSTSCSNCGEDAYAQDEGEYHRWVCSSCEHSWEAAHFWDCYDEDRVCSACGNTENMDGVEVDHVMYGGTGKYLDEYSHAQSCVCGEKVWDSEKHFANCKNPTVCAMCGASENVIIDYLSHGNASVYVDLGDTHAAECLGNRLCYW